MPGGSGAAPAPGAAVTLSIRPECWRLGAAPFPGNSVRGRIGASVYLGETSQHEFTVGDTALAILELNPRFETRPDRGEVWAGVDPEDVVVLAGETRA